MHTKLVRYVAAAAILVSIVGSTGFAPAAAGAGAQSLKPPRAAQPQPINRPALTLPPASALGVEFVHIATAANSSAHTTTIDNPLTNGQPNAKLIVTPNFNPGGLSFGTDDNHPIGVYYAAGHWEIFNQDLAAMPVNAAFNVIVPTPGANVFVQTATAGNISGNVTTIDSAVTNGNPNAILFVTPNYNPGGIGSTYDNHHIGVYYSNGRWTIFNQDGADIPLNAAFNVFVPAVGPGVFVHTATAGNSTSDYTTLDNALTNANPNAIVFVTPNYDPGGFGGFYDNHAIGVFYTGGRQKIFNQNGSNIPVGAAFNVLVLVPASDVFVQRVTPDNISSAHTTIDHPLANFHPNAIIFSTPNYNPDGLCGCMFFNDNLGVVYSPNQWGIFDQHVVAPPVDAAFNVLIPNPGANVFVQQTTSINVNGDTTFIDNPLTNGNADAMLLVTPNFDPGDIGGTFDNHPIGVWYDGAQWGVFNEDVTGMPLGAAFNVMVLSPGSNSFVHTSAVGNISGDHTTIDNPLTNGHPNAIILVTPNFDPGGFGATSLNHRIGVYYTGTKWAIFNQDTVAMPVGESFNVTVYFKDFLPVVTH